MPEDVIGKLARFTPTAVGVDRDDLLFRVGRASAPSRRPWQVIAAMLALTQAVTLGVLAWRPSGVRSLADEPSIAPVQSAPADSGPLFDESPGPSSYLILSHQDFDRPEPVAPAAGGGPAPSDPPLTAGQRSRLLNY